MNRSEKAAKKFAEGFNCAQSVVFGCADMLKNAGDPAFRAAHGFGAGMGRKQEVCGAVTGGIIVLGLLYGRCEDEGAEKQEACYAMARRLMESFERRNGSFICGRLLDGCRLLTPEGQTMFREKNLKARCAGFVTDVVEILEEMTAGNESS